MIYTTQLQAIDICDGMLKTFSGPLIDAVDWKDAQAKISSCGYLVIDGILVEDDPVKDQFIFWH